MHICKIEGCGNKVLCKELCNKHYQQVRNFGKVRERLITDKNNYTINGNCVIMDLYNNKSEVVAKVAFDVKNLEMLAAYKWRLANGYCVSTVGNTTIQMHRIIMGSPVGLEVDHRNHNTLDNTEENLRIATHIQNNQNRTPSNKTHSKSVGVYLRENGKWRVSITVNKKTIPLGTFDSEKEAIEVRKNAEKKYFGEYAYREY